LKRSIWVFITACWYKAGGILPEVFSPIEALMNGRPARGYQARDALAKRVSQDYWRRSGSPNQAVLYPGIHLHFRPCEFDVPLPLGWTLSSKTRKNLREQLSHRINLGKIHPIRQVSNYHRQLITRVMLTLNGKPGLPSSDRRKLDNYSDCLVPSE
ncbi:MAG: hypothetical protein VCE74_22770, partial [Alphaproteobacteria bacterium]